VKMATKSESKVEKDDFKRCGFYVQRKRRHCRMIPAKGNIYCAEHLCHQQNSAIGSLNNCGQGTQDAIHSSGKKRVPCPLDPKHTVFESRLQKHLEKCNSRHKQQQEYFEENINSGHGSCESLHFERVPLAQVPNEEILQLIEKVDIFHSKANLNIRECYGMHEVLQEELRSEEYGESKRKHLLQQASLIKILEQNKVFKGNIAFVELGAGKGKLSHWLQRAVGNIDNVDFFLVDRQNHRNKFDCYHKGADQGPSFQRLYIDIQHLNLDKVSDLAGKNIVGIGKHLCGGATDLALRCLVERCRNVSTDVPSKKAKFENHSKNVQLILIALCCYHKCTWSSFVGREFLIENGFNEVDFHRMTQLCSWAVCGHRQPGNCAADTQQEAAGAQNERSGVTSFTASEKEEVGLKCKRIIDLGRCNYLKGFNYNTELLYYVSPNVTLENVALLALPSSVIQD